MHQRRQQHQEAHQGQGIPRGPSAYEDFDGRQQEPIRPAHQEKYHRRYVKVIHIIAYYYNVLEKVVRMLPYELQMLPYISSSMHTLNTRFRIQMN